MEIGGERNVAIVGNDVGKLTIGRDSSSTVSEDFFNGDNIGSF